MCFWENGTKLPKHGRRKTFKAFFFVNSEEDHDTVVERSVFLAVSTFDKAEFSVTVFDGDS